MTKRLLLYGQAEHIHVQSERKRGYEELNSLSQDALDTASCTGGLNVFQGMAPAAKLAFQDLGIGASGSLTIPGDMSTGYFPFTYARQAMRGLPHTILAASPEMMRRGASEAFNTLLRLGLTFE